MEHGVTLNYVTTLNNFLLNSNLSLDWIFFSYTLHVWKNSRWSEINNYVIDQILKYIFINYNLNFFYKIIYQTHIINAFVFIYIIYSI